MALPHATRAFRSKRGPRSVSEPRNVQAWTAFWSEQGAQACCLQLAGDAVRSALGRHWETLACRLAPGERVLDIGSGAGIVGKIMLSKRPDLAIAGIDSADIPSDNPAGLTIHAGIEMEALPFPAACFGVAVSQFGFEYGDPHRAAPELARVLRPGARFSFIVHHRESSIIAANAARRSALREIFAGPLRDAFLNGDPIRLIQLVRRLGSKYGDVDVVRQLASVLPQRTGLDRHRRLAMWQAIEEALAPEGLILESLLRVSQSSQSLKVWLEPLRSVFGEVSAEPISKTNGDPIAWHISGRRP